MRGIEGFGAFAETAAKIDDASDLATGLGQRCGGKAMVQVAMLVQQWCCGACAALVHHSGHFIAINASGMLVAYHLRMPDQKREAVKRFKELNFTIVAAGDSYNDTAMLGEAHGGILFHPPENVIREFPQFPVTMNYDELRAEIDKAFAKAA